VASALLVAGCGEDRESSTAGSGTSTTPTTASGPKGSVSFVAPKDGAKGSSTVHAKVTLEDFEIAPKAVGQAPRPGQGHLHFEMDEGKYDFPKYSGKNGLIAKKLGVTGHYSPALAPTITYKHLPPGEHELEVYLANNNHTDVGIEADVKFTVK
jgi:hypothetical protein